MEAMRIAITYDGIEINKTKTYFNENSGKYNQRYNHNQTEDMEIDNITSRPRMVRQPKVCFNCQKEGHFAAKCPNKSKK